MNLLPDVSESQLQEFIPLGMWKRSKNLFWAHIFAQNC